jgi:hypothetical protein
MQPDTLRYTTNDLTLGFLRTLLILNGKNWKNNPITLKSVIICFHFNENKFSIYAHYFICKI